MSNKAKIFIAFDFVSKSGKLTKFFTGCYAYHMGFYVEETDMLYDMNLMFRKIPRPAKYIKDTTFFVLDCPVEVTEADLLEEILKGVDALCSNGSVLKNLYGFIDYFMYGFRWAYHLVGKSTPNFGGVICSEKVNEVLIKKGWESPFKEVPSPCDFVTYFKLK